MDMDDVRRFTERVTLYQTLANDTLQQELSGPSRLEARKYLRQLKALRDGIHRPIVRERLGRYLRHQGYDFAGGDVLHEQRYRIGAGKKVEIEVDAHWCCFVHFRCWGDGQVLTRDQQAVGNTVYRHADHVRRRRLVYGDVECEPGALPGGELSGVLPLIIEESDFVDAYWALGSA